MSRRILSFMAHPDDAEFICTGTMIRLQREAGCTVAIATATSGDCGSVSHGPAEIARIRHGEAVAAAAVIGAEYHVAACSDVFIMYDAPTLRRFVEVLRKANPDIVFTHPPHDYMVDHEMTSKLVRTACFAAGMPNFLTLDPDPAPPTSGVPYLYYADPNEHQDIFGNPVPAGFMVDVTDVMPIKEEMLACHASQREWLRAHHGVDEYMEMMRRFARGRGKQLGCQYAEGFRQHLGHPYPQDNIVAGLLKLS